MVIAASAVALAALVAATSISSPVPSPALEASTTTSPPPCTVSSILVPSCGAWLGASTPSADGTYDYVTGLAEYEKVAQNTPDILRFYKRDDSPFPTDEEISLSERPGHQRSILFYSWKPSTVHTWREIADGAVDDVIDAAAQRLDLYSHQLFLAVYHEPENDEGVPGSGMTSDDYVDMYRHVVARIRAAEATNVVFVMNYMGFERWAGAVDRFWPGTDVVDWIAYNPYGGAKNTDFGLLVNFPVEPDWPGFYSWATTKAPGTPLMLGEWGFDLNLQPRSHRILAGASATLRSSFPELKALIYWNDSKVGGLAVRLDQDSTIGHAFAAAYRTLANDPYFNEMSPDAAP